MGCYGDFPAIFVSGNAISNVATHMIIMKRLDPLRAKKTFIRKKFGIPRFRLLRLISDPIKLAKGGQRKILYF